MQTIIIALLVTLVAVFGFGKFNCIFTHNLMRKLL